MSIQLNPTDTSLGAALTRVLNSGDDREHLAQYLAVALQQYGAGGGGAIADAPTDGQLYGRRNAAWAVVAPAGPVGPTGASLYVYDDFILGDSWTGSVQPVGTYPGAWISTGSNAAIVPIANAGAQTGIIQIGAGGFLSGNFVANVGSALYPVPFSLINKIVFRCVFRVTASPVAGGEAVIGFTSTGQPGGNPNLWGAFVNICPNYTAALPDWDTRVTIPAASMTGFTYGVYNGAYPAAFGYKLGQLIPVLSTSTWYEAIISMIPGVSCAFYVSVYGSPPALDRTCTVIAQIPTHASEGPIPNMSTNGAFTNGSLLVDKVEYALWTTEGYKALGQALANF